MVSATTILPTMKFTMPALEAFPTSLSVLNLAGLESQLDKETTNRLSSLEKQFQSNVSISRILRARSEKSFDESLTQGYTQAINYYVESGIIIWRALNNDYDKLLETSRVSATLVEKLFFDHTSKLNDRTFVTAVTGLRVLTKVGEWIILSEKYQNNGTPPLGYLSVVIEATFLMWCIVAYLTNEVKNARKENLAAIANRIMELGKKVYDDAIKLSIPEVANEPNHWYWNPSWQEGEVEADLDKRLNKVQKFGSLEELIQDLKE